MTYDIIGDEPDLDPGIDHTKVITHEGRDYSCVFTADPRDSSGNTGTYTIQTGSYVTTTQPASFPSEAHRDYILNQIIAKLHIDLSTAEAQAARRNEAIQKRLEEKRKREEELANA